MVLLKCCLCKKEIDKNDAVYAPKKKSYYYFCIKCYKNRKDFNESKFQEYLKETYLKLENMEIEKKLNSWFYDNIGFLDVMFFTKRSKINNGKFSTKQFPLSNVSFSISNEELLDMCVMMETYIKKQISQLKDNTYSTHYVLAILYNSYPKYLEYKIKNKSIENENNIVERISDTIKNKSIQTCSIKNDLDIDDFLL